MIVGDVEVVRNAVIKCKFNDLPHCFSHMTYDTCLIQFVALASYANVQRAYVLEGTHLKFSLVSVAS